MSLSINSCSLIPLSFMSCTAFLATPGRTGIQKNFMYDGGRSSLPSDLSQAKVSGMWPHVRSPSTPVTARSLASITARCASCVPERNDTPVLCLGPTPRLVSVNSEWNCPFASALQRAARLSKQNLMILTSALSLTVVMSFKMQAMRMTFCRYTFPGSVLIAVMYSKRPRSVGMDSIVSRSMAAYSSRAGSGFLQTFLCCFLEGKRKYDTTG
ncbi:hypothetical protein PENSPDRAFT_453784 [Peniophora sp. CONT]|nr:hypothetical protein PENSPDRAFT_453784 [Peniophora sp. CONT]